MVFYKALLLASEFTNFLRAFFMVCLNSSLSGPMKKIAACDLRAGTVARRTQGRSPFHPKQTSSWSHFSTGHPLPATPFQCPRSRTAALERGAAALTCPYVGLTVHRAVSVRRMYDRRVTQSTATPEPSSRTTPTLDQVLVTC